MTLPALHLKIIFGLSDSYVRTIRIRFTNSEANRNLLIETELSHVAVHCAHEALEQRRRLRDACLVRGACRIVESSLPRDREAQ